METESGWEPTPQELWARFDASPRGRELMTAAYLADAYAALAAAWGVDEEWSNIPGGHVYRRGADGGLWLVPATPSDEQVMRPIVEAAMRADGMAVPLRPIIPTLRHLIADQTEQEHHG